MRSSGRRRGAPGEAGWAVDDGRATACRAPPLDSLDGRVLVRAMLRLGRVSGVGSLIVCLLLVFFAMPLDPLVHRLTFRYVDSHGLRLVANGFTLLGSGWAASGLLGVLLVMGRQTGDGALVRASLGGLGGVLVGTVIGHAVKQLACRARPRLVDGWGVAGDPGSGAAGLAAGGAFFRWPCLTDSLHQSFPSGHASAAFAVAAALACAVPARRRLWLGVAAAVGASRVVLNAHFVSDVLGGAVIGWWATELTLRMADRVSLAADGAPADAAGRAGLASRCAAGLRRLTVAAGIRAEGARGGGR